MKRWLIQLLLVAFVLPQSALAGVTWCKSDPVVTLNGTIVDVTVEIPLEYVPFVNGPIQYTIQTPSSVQRKVVVSDLGYNGYGSTVRFTDRVGGVDGTRFLTTFSVKVPIDRSRLAPDVTVPARLNVFPANGSMLVVTGTSANTSMTVWITSLYGSLTGVALQVIGTGDFDGDRKSDILWRDKVTGKLTIWLMNGTIRRTHGSPGTPPVLTMEVAGIGHFDGDGKSDIVWRDSVTGKLTIWLISGTTLRSSSSPGTMSDLNFRLAGVGDFNGDSKSDILWHSAVSGKTAIWLMNGITRSSSGSPGTLPDLTWRVASVGDFNGNGKSDVLWQYGIAGIPYVSLMNGTIRSSGSPGAVVDPS